MANSVTTQVTVDGVRKTVVKLDFLLDTSDLGSTVVIDPALQLIDPLAPTTQYRIDEMWYSIQAPLVLSLFWDATTPVRIVDLSGASKSDDLGKRIGGYQNNAGAGKTGKILASTKGWAAGSVGGTVTFELVKQ